MKLSKFVSVVNELRDKGIERIEAAGYNCSEDVSDREVAFDIELDGMAAFLKFLSKNSVKNVFYQVGMRDVSDFLITDSVIADAVELFQKISVSDCDACNLFAGCDIDVDRYNAYVFELFRHCPEHLRFFVFVDGVVVGTYFCLMTSSEYDVLLTGHDLVVKRLCEVAGTDFDDDRVGADAEGVVDSFASDESDDMDDILFVMMPYVGNTREN